MLVLRRKLDEKLLIDEKTEIQIIRISGSHVSLGITAPPDVTVLRGGFEEHGIVMEEPVNDDRT